ncbi:autotransporter assembly complex protein TamA [Aliisedimentitalea scapharcae]|uniref:Autotransporter assembly complex protein TamA n=1 Tax=Aliisedimentitalea scapharcae TaxID=1524259 RepID=A0ABZ2XXA3_9RHOB
MVLLPVRVRSRALMLAISSAILCVSAPPSDAVETTLSAPQSTDELREQLIGSSAIMGAETQGLDTVQELLAASLSDYRTLVQVLYNAGYFSPTVNIRLDGREAATIPPLNPPGAVNKIAITVDPGRLFTFGLTRVAPLPPDTKLPTAFATGQTAGTGAIRDAAVTGQQAWRNAGHAKARVGAQRITANHATDTIDADIQLSPGPQLTFGNLNLTGETRVRPDAIQRIAGFPTGQVFSPDQAQLVGTRLRRTGTFASVALREAETPNPDGSLDFTAEFADLPQRRLTFGAELSSNEGLDLTANWMHRNLFGGAEKLRFESRITNIGGNTDIGGRIGLRLDRPDTLGPDDNTYYLAEVESLDELHYSAVQGLLGMGVRREFSKGVFGEAALIGSTILADDAFGTNRRFKFFGVPLRLEMDKRDSKVSATKGYFLNATAMPYAGYDGTASGLRLTADGRMYRRLGGNDGRLVIAGRLQLGSIIGPSLQDVSPTMSFFSGGAGSVRGQPYQSLGIPVGTGSAGGRSYLAGSAEIRGYVSEKISLVGFYDVGLIGRDAFVTGGSTQHSGAGIGVRYDLGGFGPLRLDLAYPTSGPTSDGLQFYIGIGQAF